MYISPARTGLGEYDFSIHIVLSVIFVTQFIDRKIFVDITVLLDLLFGLWSLSFTANYFVGTGIGGCTRSTTQTDRVALHEGGKSIEGDRATFAGGIPRV